MPPRPPVLRALLGAVARPALFAFVAAIGVAGVLAAIVLGSSDSNDPPQPTPDGTAIVAPSDLEIALLQRTPTPEPTQPPTKGAPTEAPTDPVEPQPTPTPRVVQAPTAPPRPTTAPPTAIPDDDPAPAEFERPAAPVPSPTPVPNVQVTPSPTPPPPPPPSDLPPAQVLEPVDLAPEPTRAPREDRSVATVGPDDEEPARRDAPPTPTAIRIVPGGPSGTARDAAAASEAPPIEAADLGDQIQATVEAALSASGAPGGGGRGNRPVGLPAQTAEPDEPVRTVIKPVDAEEIIAAITVPTIEPRNPAARPNTDRDARPTVAPSRPGRGANRPPRANPPGRPPDPPGRGNGIGDNDDDNAGNGDDSPFCPTFPFCDDD